MSKKFTLGLLFLQLVCWGHAQRVGIGTTTPHASAMLDVSSVNKGLLLPRMTTGQRNAISNPAHGLLVFDTGLNGLVFYNGSGWVPVSNAAASPFALTNGVVHNVGDMVSDNFIFGASSIPKSVPYGDEVSLFYFNKDKGALRVGFMGYEAEERWATENIGSGSTAFGANNTARGLYSTCFGKSNLAGNTGSFIVGYANEALATYSTAIGSYNYSSGPNSFIAGTQNRTYGDNAIVLGHQSQARGYRGVAIGLGLYANSYGSVVLGMYNDTTDTNANAYLATDPLLTIGNGSSPLLRRNAVTVLKNGQVGIGNDKPTATLDITSEASASVPQQHLKVRTNDYVRFRMSSTIYAKPYWDMASITHTSTSTNAAMNFFYSQNGATGIDVLSLKGNGNATLAGVLTQNSDARLKTGIQKIDNAMLALESLSGYQYRWKDAGRDQSLQTGLLAQEVEKVMPELVKEDENGTKSVNYNGLIPYLLEAVKLLKAELDAIKIQH